MMLEVKYTRFSFIILIISLLVSCAPSSNDAIEEVTIIGGGLMGSSTAWHLSQLGLSVLLLEKQDSIYTSGSSYGTARIARSSNRGSDIWSYLHNRSVEETKPLLDHLNELNPEEHLSMGEIYTTTPVTYVGRMSIYDKLLASLERQNIDYELAVHPDEGLAKFEVNLPDDVLIQREYNTHSGTINPKRLIELLHRAVRSKNGRIQYSTTVESIHREAKTGLYQLTINDQKTGEAKTIYSRRIISAAGPHTGSLLSHMAPYFDTLITPQRVFLAFLKIKDEIYNGLTKEQTEKIADYYPVINSAKGTRSGSFFSMIEYYDEGNPVIKIGGHFQRSPIEDLESVWSKGLSPQEIEWSLNSTASYFQLLNIPVLKNDLEIVDEYSCVYSLTSSEVPYVTPIRNSDGSPDHNFVVLGGMSGVGAKGAMTYGRLAAHQLMQTSEQDTMYTVVSSALGFERLQDDIGN